MNYNSCRMRIYNSADPGPDTWTCTVAKVLPLKITCKVFGFFFRNLSNGLFNGIPATLLSHNENKIEIQVDQDPNKAIKISVQAQFHKQEKLKNKAQIN